MVNKSSSPVRKPFPGRVPISASITAKDKDAITLLTGKGFFPSESDFVARAISDLLRKCKGEGKFKWKELEL